MSDAPKNEPPLTERQRKWFASVRASLERETGKSLDEWVAIARTCPETRPRARLKWFKETHGLLQNRASFVLGEAFGSEMGWDAPDALVAALWTDRAARAIYDRLDAAALAHEGALRTPRKGYTAWARNFQFAAARPVRGGVLLGLALGPPAHARLEARGPSPAWSERLLAQTKLATPEDVDAELIALIEAAFFAS